MNLVGVLEGLLFVVGDEGVTLEDICSILNVSIDKAKELLTTLKKEYDKEERGIKISYLGNTFKLTTKKEHKEFYQKLVKERVETLSQAQLEVLAIVAYNEPITRIEIDEIRGISSTYVVRKLLSKDLIKVFLDFFGLASLHDLPELVIEKPQEEVPLFETKEL